MNEATNLTATPPVTLVVGLGKTGLSCARYLAARGEPFAVIDSRAAPPGLDELRAAVPDAELYLGGFDEAVFSRAGRLVVSPGVPVATREIRAAAARGAEVLGDVELFARDSLRSGADVVAITGSNGKSTVTTLVGHMAERAGWRTAVGGNLGDPTLDLLADGVEVYVLELSSFQLETTSSLAPKVACVLNLSPDHMDRYATLADYAAAKARIFAGAAIAVVNADDPAVVAMPGGQARWTFGTGHPQGDDGFGILAVEGERWLARGTRPILRAAQLRMPGEHNLANALAALAIGAALGLDEAAMCEALREFGGLPHRTEFVAERRGVAWYNDSKGTNVGASVAALAGLDRSDDSRTVLIAGGDCKGADFGQLAHAVRRYARAVVLIGRDAPRLRAALADTVELVDAPSLGEAVARAAELARTGDRVLLSPACASFDMFRNYEDRGERFRALVREVCA